MICCCKWQKTQTKPIYDPVGTIIVKTLYIIPVFRTSLTPIVIDDEEEEKAHAVIVTFEKPITKKGIKGSISSLNSQPITQNLSQAAHDDPAPTPSPAIPNRRRFSFKS